MKLNGKAAAGTKHSCTERVLCSDLAKWCQADDEEEPHVMNLKGGSQLWQPSGVGISLIGPSVRYRSPSAMSISAHRTAICCA